MVDVYIDNILTRNILDIGEIPDQLSPNGSSFSISLLGYPPTNKIGRVRIEVYDDFGDLAAVGNGIPTIKVGKRVITTYQVGDLVQHLTRKRIKTQLNGSLESTLDLLLSYSQASMYFNFIRFRTSSDTPDLIISQYIDYQFFKDAITQVLSATGRLLQYKVPIDEKCIEILEYGYSPVAPITEIDIGHLLECNTKGIKDINYSVIQPIASVIRVYGRNGRNIKNNVTSLNPDILRYRAQDGRDNYPILETADEVLLIKITTPSDVYCFLLSWTATGIFTPTSGTPTGSGFTIDGADLGVGATGSFTVTIDLPATPSYFWRWLEYATSNIAGSGTGGTIKVFIDGSLVTSRDIVEGNGTVLSGTSLFSYSDTTVELKFEYDGSTYSSSGFTGSFTYAPIRVCPEPQTNVPNPGGWYNEVHEPIRPEDISSDTHTVELINPDTGSPEFFAFKIQLSSLADSDPGNYCKLYIDGGLVFSFDFTVGSSLIQYYLLDESLAGQTVEIKLESFVAASGLGFSAIGSLVYA